MPQPVRPTQGYLNPLTKSEQLREDFKAKNLLKHRLDINLENAV
jgi:hypothetical protein